VTEIRQQKRATKKRVIEDIEVHKKEPRLFFKKCRSAKEGFKARINFITDISGFCNVEVNSMRQTHNSYKTV